MADHERIWLQHPDDAAYADEGRLWCEDKVWPDDPEDGEPTEYVRADLLAEARAQIAATVAECDRVCDSYAKENQQFSDKIIALEAQIAAKDAALREIVDTARKNTTGYNHMRCVNIANAALATPARETE